MVFSFELVRQRQFNYGQVYVALRGVKALSDLSFVGDINTKSIKVDKLIETEYERLRASRNFDDSSANIVSKSNAHNVVITLFNIRSFKKHYLDQYIFIIFSTVIDFSSEKYSGSTGHRNFW